MTIALRKNINPQHKTQGIAEAGNGMHVSWRFNSPIDFFPRSQHVGTRRFPSQKLTALQKALV